MKKGTLLNYGFVQQDRQPAVAGEGDTTGAGDRPTPQGGQVTRPKAQVQLG